MTTPGMTTSGINTTNMGTTSNVITTPIVGGTTTTTTTYIPGQNIPLQHGYPAADNNSYYSTNQGSLSQRAFQKQYSATSHNINQQSSNISRQTSHRMANSTLRSNSQQQLGNIVQGPARPATALRYAGGFDPEYEQTLLHQYRQAAASNTMANAATNAVGNTILTTLPAPLPADKANIANHHFQVGQVGSPEGYAIERHQAGVQPLQGGYVHQTNDYSSSGTPIVGPGVSGYTQREAQAQSAYSQQHFDGPGMAGSAYHKSSYQQSSYSSSMATTTTTTTRGMFLR